MKKLAPRTTAKNVVGMLFNNFYYKRFTKINLNLHIFGTFCKRKKIVRYNWSKVGVIDPQCVTHTDA